ncbi:MAG: DJ-1/PfpI family protein [Acidimicrobiales bacterium]
MSLEGRRVAVLAEEGYQELELWYPVMRFREEGADVVIAAPQSTSAYESRLGYPLLAQTTIAELDPGAFDAVVVPGGEAGKRLSGSDEAVELVRKAQASGALTAALGSGIEILVAGVVESRRVAGESTEDVVVDDGVITARDADDLPAFVRAIRQSLAAGQS